MGSTWTGRVIEQAKETRYVHEPFNIGIKRANSPLKFWFEHFPGTTKEHQEKGVEYLNSFTSMFHKKNLKRVLGAKSARELYWCYTDLKSAGFKERTIVKDPIAIMSAEWIYQQFGWDMVVLVRHPAAFVASLKVQNWEFDFNHYKNQPMLLKNYLQDYAETIADYSENKKDIVDQGILLWNTIHHVIKNYMNTYCNDWYFVKHEDLSINPIGEFEKMFSFLELEMSQDVKDYILDSTTSKNTSDLKRNSVENTKTWKKRLSEKEIARIKEGTAIVWKNFYREEDW